MCGCEGSFVCAKCRPRDLVDLVIEAAAVEPRTLQEALDEQKGEYVATVILPALKP